MEEYVNPFDFGKIFIDYALGSPEIFVFAFIFIFSYVCARFQFSNRVFMVLLVISTLLFYFAIGQSILILMLLIITPIVFKSLAKLLT